MENKDFEKRDFDPSTIDPNICRACVKLSVGVSDFFVPLGSVEKFILIALSGGNCITIESVDNLQFCLKDGNKNL